MRQRILVFGGSGWVGRALVPFLQGRGDEVAAPSHAACDLCDRSAVARLVAEWQPTGVINCAVAGAQTSDEARLFAVNATGARNVAAAAAQVGARLVHVSTDLVLDGQHPPYLDDAAPNPLSAYGRSKAEGEAAVSAEDPSAVIVRTSNIYDPRSPDPSLAAFIERLESGQKVRLFTDEIRCPIARPTFVSALAELLTLDVSGTLNVAGEEPLSRFEYGTLLLNWFDIPNRHNIEAGLSADLSEPRPRDLTLDTSKARASLSTRLRGVRATLAAEGRSRS